MLVNLKKLLNFAEENNCAIGSFNFTSFESLTAAIKVAEKLSYPIIISHAPVHDIFYGIDILGPIAVKLASESKAMICVHLDHCSDITYIKKAIGMGFTSVMFDGSSLPFEENVKQSKEVVDYAKSFNVSVEGELGRIMSNGLEGAHEGTNNDDYYTDPIDAALYVELTKVDCLAISFGTVHGIYTKAPKLNYDLIKEVRNKANNIPIVMHGGSGISDDDYIKVINAGVRKINYYTYMQIAGYKGVKKLVESNSTTYYHDIVMEGKKAMFEDIKRVVNLFKNK